MNTVKIGWGRREFSTDKRVNINGQMYMRPSKGVLDPLYATAMAIDGGEGQDAFVFCSVDRTGFSETFYYEVLDAVVAKKPEIPRDCIILGATHTHTSVDIDNIREKTPDGVEVVLGKDIRPFVVDRISDAIVEAWENRAEGAIAYGYGYATVGFSRRVVYTKDMNEKYFNIIAPHGKCVQYGKTTEDEFSHYETNSDASVNLMFTYDANKKLTGIVVNIPCPSQASEVMEYLTADYWAQVREEVAKEFGPDVYVLTQCAPGGDMTPRPMHYLAAEDRRFALKYDAADENGKVKYFERSMGRRKDIGERVIACIKEVYAWASKDIQSEIPVRHCRERVELTWRPFTEDEKNWCEENIKTLEASIPSPEGCTPEEYRVAKNRSENAIRRNQNVLRYYEMQKTKKKLPYHIHTAQIGEVAWATNPFELFADYMTRIQARSPFTQSFLIQLAGEDGGGYLPTERACINKSYSACMFDNHVTDIGGQELVEYTLKKFKEFKAMDEEQA